MKRFRTNASTRQLRSVCLSFSLAALLALSPFGFMNLEGGAGKAFYAAPSAPGLPLGPPAFGTDINLITDMETLPHVTQDQSSTWGHGETVVVVYNDSRGSQLSPQSYCGASVSTDGGTTFTRLPYLFNEGGACFGDPSVFYSVAATKWYISAFSTRCGSLGIGQWESSNGIDWANSGCVASLNQASNPTSWVDNNPGSPFYGRQYVSFNDLALNVAVRLTFSTDNGLTWSAPTSVFASNPFRRAIKVTGSLDADGTIFIQTMDQVVANNITNRNFIYRSTDGGATWSTGISQGAASPPPGRVDCFGLGLRCMYDSPSYWLELGWGQPGVGPNGVVHYAYSASIRNGDGSVNDPGNIYYIRSTDNGSTWSAPLQLNTDTTARAQWRPALAVNAQGAVVVSWYDERNTTDKSLERFGRVSLDNGATWSDNLVVSDVVFPVPLQPDPAVRQGYVGFYDHAAFSDDGYGNIAYHTWTDGRVPINGTPQQDVFFDKITVPQPSPITAGNALLLNESCPPANGAIDPGERATVNLELMNTSSAATANLVATLQSSGGVLAPTGPQSYGAIAVNGSPARDFSFTVPENISWGRTITATLQLQDGANNLGTVSFTFTAGPAPCSFVRLVVSSSLSRGDASTVVGAITVRNIGSLTANNLTLTTAKLGATNGTPLPQGLGNLAPGESAGVMLNFSNSTPGSSSMLTVGGTHSGGTFTSSRRVIVP